MSFRGFNFSSSVKIAKKSLNGFYGFNISLDLIGVRITDSRGKGLGNVKVSATNPTSGLPFIGYTDQKGSVFMELDTPTELLIEKDLIFEIVQYNGEVSPTYILDIPIIK